jgi:hypothetical protein
MIEEAAKARHRNCGNHGVHGPAAGTGAICGVTQRPGALLPVLALSLGGLRRRIETLMLPDDVIVMLNLDRAARLERDRRRAKITAPSAARSRAGFPP